jgi:glycosyltransferase involved in cell wall biosynthesis
LVSVIIPCYNHGRYLSKAIESVLSQDYSQIELIVIDDGSDDNTREIATAYNLKYIYQDNQGLAAARNTGIQNSNGKFLVFLDADDWLLNRALSINVSYLEEAKEAAFVAGAHKKIISGGEYIGKQSFPGSPYCNLLKYGNYIEMHAAVMFRRWVFDLFRYDVSLKACEDYDIYLNVTRKYVMVQHSEPIAAYYKHHDNMSNNSVMMLEAALSVLNRQQSCLLNKVEEECLKNGISFWTGWYGNLIYKKLLAHSNEDKVKEELKALWRYKKDLFFKYFIVKSILPFKSYAKRYFPQKILNFLQKTTSGAKFIPQQGRVNKGDLNRTTPFSTQFGYDRGGPLDRYYIESFLKQHNAFIKGKVLEIGDNEYTMRFGGNKVMHSDILHVDEQNTKATFYGDLSHAPHLPDNHFDCIVLTQTLHLIYNYHEAVKTCYRILKPGGALLLTVPGISHIDQGEWKQYWLWSFTGASIKKILAEIFHENNTEIATYGNVLVAASFLYGLGFSELKKEQLDYFDPHYQVIISAVAIK